MASVTVARVDHFGVIASVVEGVGVIEMIDARGLRQDPEEITAGEAVAGMIRKGLGLSTRPVSFTPPCFANQPRALWWRAGGRAEMCNRCKRGRTLDEVHADGGDRWCRERALAVWTQAGLEGRFPPLDPTSFALTGD